jgi:hypothetical protein
MTFVQAPEGLCVLQAVDPVAPELDDHQAQRKLEKDGPLVRPEMGTPVLGDEDREADRRGRPQRRQETRQRDLRDDRVTTTSSPT